MEQINSLNSSVLTDDEFILSLINDEQFHPVRNEAKELAKEAITEKNNTSREKRFTGTVNGVTPQQTSTAQATPQSNIKRTFQPEQLTTESNFVPSKSFHGLIADTNQQVNIKMQQTSPAVTTSQNNNYPHQSYQGLLLGMLQQGNTLEKGTAERKQADETPQSNYIPQTFHGQFADINVQANINTQQKSPAVATPQNNNYPHQSFQGSLARMLPQSEYLQQGRLQGQLGDMTPQSNYSSQETLQGRQAVVTPQNKYIPETLQGPLADVNTQTNTNPLQKSPAVATPQNSNYPHRSFQGSLAGMLPQSEYLQQGRLQQGQLADMTPQSNYSSQETLQGRQSVVTPQNNYIPETLQGPLADMNAQTNTNPLQISPVDLTSRINHYLPETFQGSLAGMLPQSEYFQQGRLQGQLADMTPQSNYPSQETLQGTQADVTRQGNYIPETLQGTLADMNAQSNVNPLQISPASVTSQSNHYPHETFQGSLAEMLPQSKYFQQGRLQGQLTDVAPQSNYYQQGSSQEPPGEMTSQNNYFSEGTLQLANAKQESNIIPRTFERPFADTNLQTSINPNPFQISPAGATRQNNNYPQGNCQKEQCGITPQRNYFTQGMLEGQLAYVTPQSNYLPQGTSDGQLADEALQSNFIPQTFKRPFTDRKLQTNINPPEISTAAATSQSNYFPQETFKRPVAGMTSQSNSYQQEMFKGSLSDPEAIPQQMPPTRAISESNYFTKETLQGQLPQNNFIPRTFQGPLSDMRPQTNSNPLHRSPHVGTPQSNTFQQKTFQRPPAGMTPQSNVIMWTFEGPLTDMTSQSNFIPPEFQEIFADMNPHNSINQQQISPVAGTRHSNNLPQGILPAPLQAAMSLQSNFIPHGFHHYYTASFVARCGSAIKQFFSIGKMSTPRNDTRKQPYSARKSASTTCKGDLCLQCNCGTQHRA